MTCLITSKPTAPRRAARTALFSATSSRGSRAITQRKISQFAAMLSTKPTTPSKTCAHAWLDRPRKLQHRPGEARREARHREGEDQRDPQPEQR